VLEDAAAAIGLALQPGLELIVIGETKGWLGQSLWLREVAGREDGAPPPVDLAAERRNGDFVRARILAGQVAACHDVADGGLLVAVAEMAIGGGVGATLDAPAGIPGHAFWFGEDQGRYVLAVADGAATLAAAKEAGVPASRLGRTGGGDLVPGAGSSISVAALRAAHEGTLPRLMEAVG
jgi:phosphoribosylformylglycinamidine synthase